MKKRVLWTVLRVAAIAFFLAVIGFLIYRVANKKEEKPQSVVSGDTAFSLTFVDVGEGDCMLLVCDNEAMLIDAGDEDHAGAVTRCLAEHNVTRLAYVLATHPHADHIGGMKKVLKKVDEVGQFLMPNVSHDTATYEKLLDTLEEREIPVSVPSVGDKYTVGSATLTVLSPREHVYKDDLNDYSVVVMVEYVGKKILLSADTGPEPQNEMMLAGDLSCDVYKVAHHGSYYNNSPLWLDALSPRYAVISCDGKGDNHPSGETVAMLRERGADVYRTDQSGNVTLLIDPLGNITFTTEK